MVKIPQSKQVKVSKKVKEIIQEMLDCQTEKIRQGERISYLLNELNKCIKVPVGWSIKFQNGKVVIDKTYNAIKLTSEEINELEERGRRVRAQVELQIRKEINQEYDQKNNS